MPQIIFKERATHLGSYTFFNKRCWSILKHVTFTALSTTKNSFFTEHFHWLPSSCEYCKVFKNGLFYRTPPEALQIFLKIGILKSFANFTGKHLCWGLFLKNLQAEGLQLRKKKSPIAVFCCEVCIILKNTLSCPSYRASPVIASALPVAAFVFF